MREYGIPVMFDVTAADHVAAARTLHGILAPLHLSGLRVNDRPATRSRWLLRAGDAVRAALHLTGRHERDESRLESWWFIEAAHKHIDGNDNADGDVIFLDGSDPRAPDRHDRDLLHLGPSTALSSASRGQLPAPELIDNPTSLTHAVSPSPRMEFRMSEADTPLTAFPHWTDPVVTPQGVIYTPWTNGWSIGYRCQHADGRVEYLYLNASSSDDSDTEAGSVFVYQGEHADPAADTPQHWYGVFDASHAAEARDRLAVLLSPTDATNDDAGADAELDLRRRILDNCDLITLVAGLDPDEPGMGQPYAYSTRFRAQILEARTLLDTTDSS